ncbi:PKD domain-containing protein [Methanosarcina sp. DH1]|uniref:PKD domain-containing protein n=1 Tax=Methanosarcina sp. DH1 TaxID=2605695 RepID=UPI001E2BC1F5|nr:PKD domain-containing protein [Methanosarcina sp. DH1]MCC4765510.1 PKD domain-containing protein [Methanosarcina sp. DH1]
MSDIKRDVKSSVKDFTQGSVSKVVKESTKKLIKNLPEKQKKLLEDRIVNMSDDQLEQYFADDPYFKDALENTIKSASDIPPKKSPGFWKKRTELVSKGTSENLATALSPQVVISIILVVASVALLAILFLKPPVANFTTSVPNASLTIQFNDTSSYHPTSWEWDFGDNNTSTEQNLTHKYSKAGNYTVTLTASNVAGSNTTTKEKSVNKTLQTPVANFSSNVSSGKAPFSVKFTDKSTEIPTKWNWSFGDGKASTQQNPEHQYSKAGMYTVTFTASNAAGSNTTTKENYMKVTGKTVANFTSNATRGHVPLTVQFTDFSQNATGWNWDFGDGTSSSDQSPVHVYFPAGTHNVNLTVTNENETDSKFATIVALGKKDHDHNPKILPVANFTSNVTSGYVPLSVLFTDLSQNATEWNWNFGDRTTHSIVDNPIHEYLTAGNYTVTLTAINAAGSNTTTKENYIKVEPIPEKPVGPVAIFSASPTLGSIPLKVQFTDNSTGKPEEWKWDFGDETISTEKNPVNIYFKAGNHTVNLTVTNKNGTNSTSATITVRCA